MYVYIKDIYRYLFVCIHIISLEIVEIFLNQFTTNLESMRKIPFPFLESLLSFFLFFNLYVSVGAVSVPLSSFFYNL